MEKKGQKERSLDGVEVCHGGLAVEFCVAPAEVFIYITNL